MEKSPPFLRRGFRGGSIKDTNVETEICFNSRFKPPFYLPLPLLIIGGDFIFVDLLKFLT